MLLCSKASWPLEEKLVCHCNLQQTSWSPGVTESRARPTLVEMVLNCLTGTALYVNWDYRSKQSVKGLGKFEGCLSNEGMMEGSKAFVIPATGASMLYHAERPFCHFCYGAVSDGTATPFLPV